MGQAVIAPMIFFNIGWMEEYAGAFAHDKTIGGHKHLKSHDHGHEALNFKPYRGKLYGYRPGKGIDLTKLGAKRSDQSVDGVTVVWMARHPRQNRCFIVGWYLNATVLRRGVEEDKAVRSLLGDKIEHLVVAQAGHGILLPTLARNFEIPSSKVRAGGFGQSTTWYGGDEDFRQRVSRYIARHGQRRPPVGKNARGTKGRGGRQPDPELRRKIEKAAINHATDYYSSKFGGGYIVDSVETEAKGWDLEAVRDDGELLIEVKGRQGSIVCAEITPNEHQAMHSVKYRNRYVLYVVTDALVNPVASIFQFDKKQNVWSSEDGRKLKIVLKTGSIVNA